MNARRKKPFLSAKNLGQLRMRAIIASLKIASFLALTLITIPLQALDRLLLEKTRFFYIIPTMYFKITAWIFQIKTKQIGNKHNGQVVFVGNHLSYIDIPVIGGKLDATFISKADVRNWPLFGILSALAKTIFIERSRNAVQKCISDIQKMLNEGRSLILFPEGTSTNGLKVLPFKSTIFELFLNETLKDSLYVQPFTVSLEKIDGKTITDATQHDLYAWYGDMTFMPHLWQLAKTKGTIVTLTLHEARKASDYDDRKSFALDCQQDVEQELKKSLPSTLDFASEAA